MGSSCTLCPRRCISRPGFCGAGDKLKIFRYGPHFGEEPPITGENGSGCVFFSHCTMKCVYCQNSPWSWCGEGEEKTPEDLVGIFRKLALEDKVENFNLVSPTPYLPFIERALEVLEKEGVRLPVVWNSSGYESVETLERYKKLCDHALFDLRYSTSESAYRYSKTEDYVYHARAALKWALRHTHGRSYGLIVRLLVLPSLADEAVENLKWIARELGNETPVSIMAQYTPAYKAKDIPPLDRALTKEEYERVVDASSDLGFENGWIQDFAASDPSLALLGENMPSDYGAVR